jgi:hypothetical protein
MQVGNAHENELLPDIVEELEQLDLTDRLGLVTVK